MAVCVSITLRSACVEVWSSPDVRSSVKKLTLLKLCFRRQNSQ